MNILDQHAPENSKVIVVGPKVPWFTDELRHLKRKRRKFERRMRKSGLEADRLVFRSVCNEYSALLKASRSAYYSDRIPQCAGDSRKLFQIVKSLCREGSGPILPEFNDPVSLVNDFGEFFIKKINLIMENIDGICVEAPSRVDRPSPSVKLKQFTLLSKNNVVQLIERSSNATCRLDPLPTWLLKSCTDAFAPMITTIVNYSLSEGYIPDQWKTGQVIPLQKKKGSDFDFKNYRPVSNLPFISKIVEKAVVDQLLRHCDDNALLPDYQSAYHRFSSTESVLLKVQSDVLLNMDKQEVTLLVLLDISAAIDTVNHSLLLNILENDFGVTDTALKWFQLYLSGRKQRILIDNSLSDVFNLTCGVPQGSCLGPVLFLLYASKLFDVVKTTFPPLTPLRMTLRSTSRSNQTRSTARTEQFMLSRSELLIFVHGWSLMV